MLVSRWCYQSGPLKVIGQLSLMALAARLIKFVIGLLEVRLAVSFSSWISRL